MAEPTTTRKDIRQKVIKKLYAGKFPIVETTTGTAAKTTSVVECILSPSGQFEVYNSTFFFFFRFQLPFFIGDPFVPFPSIFIDLHNDLGINNFKYWWGF